jgi:hypothetical protein
MNPGGSGLLNGFLTGLLNPLLVTAHFVALLGLGLMIGQQTRRRTSAVTFAVGLLYGLAALASAVGETPANTLLLTAAAAAGLAAATGRSMPLLVGAPLALAIGIGVGLDSPPQVTRVHAAHAALVGTAISACAIVALIASAIAWLNHGWLRIAAQVLGSWVVASAILVLALRFAR